MTTVNAQTILKGDMNNDEQVSIADVTSLVNVILGKAPQEVISLGGDPLQGGQQFGRRNMGGSRQLFVCS